MTQNTLGAQQTAQDASSQPTGTRSLRLELFADGKLVAKQDVLIPMGLKLKTAALCATELLNNAIIGRVPEALQGMGFK